MAEPGRYADGGGLYLVVDKNGKRWVMLYRIPGGRREMGLGSVNAVPLLVAREKARDARALLAAGKDPIVARDAAQAAPKTFSEVAIDYIETHGQSWRNPKHRAQWRSTLEKGASYIWTKPVADIETADVVKVLKPIWTTKTETARRIRGRIESVLDTAIVLKMRDGPNPARFKGHLDKVLGPNKKLARGHHPAMAYADLPAFYQLLTDDLAPSAAALRFIILTAARSGEVRGMTWAEISTDEKLWTVPAERMKGKRIHRVPLPEEAVAILNYVKTMERPGVDLVFPALRSNRPMSDMAFTMYLRRAKLADATVHGFRSTFRDWVAEETEFPSDLAEAALAHLVGDETERAYRRGDVLQRRRHLMDAWAAFVTGTALSSSTR